MFPGIPPAIAQTGLSERFPEFGVAFRLMFPQMARPPILAFLVQIGSGRWAITDCQRFLASDPRARLWHCAA